MNFLEEAVSVVIPDRLYFAGFPRQEDILQLESNGFTHLLDLTDGEECPPYHTRLTRIHFPIADHGTPRDPIGYCQEMTRIRSMFRQEGSKWLVHCRGGHGRSSMVCVSLWMLWKAPERVSVNHAIAFINQAHLTRPRLRAKWRARRMPFNHEQASFLHRMHKTIFIGQYTWLLPKAVESRMTSSLTDQQDIRSMSSMIREWLVENDEHLARFQLTFLRSFQVLHVSSEWDEWIRECLFELRNEVFELVDRVDGFGRPRLTPPQDAAEEKAQNSNPNPDVPWT